MYSLDHRGGGYVNVDALILHAIQKGILLTLDVGLRDNPHNLASYSRLSYSLL